jgi:hypothetical protein
MAEEQRTASLSSDQGLLRDLLAQLRELTAAMKNEGENAAAMAEWCNRVKAEREMSPSPFEEDPFAKENSFRLKGLLENAHHVVKHLDQDGRKAWNEYWAFAEANLEDIRTRAEKLESQQEGPFNEAIDRYIASNKNLDTDEVREMFALRNALMEHSDCFEPEAKSCVAVLNFLEGLDKRIVAKIEGRKRGSETDGTKSHKRRGGQSTENRDIELAQEYGEGLEAGRWDTKAAFAKKKGMKRDTISKAIDRGEAAELARTLERRGDIGTQIPR